MVINLNMVNNKCLIKLYLNTNILISFIFIIYDSYVLKTEEIDLCKMNYVI